MLIQKKIDNISSNMLNLEKINENKNNISSYLTKINKINSFMKNSYNDLIDDFNYHTENKTFIFEKEYNMEYNINSFIEIDYNILLNYENINERNYVKSTYEIRDSEKNVLYTSIIDHNKYSYFENYLTIKEKIFIILISKIRILNS